MVNPAVGTGLGGQLTMPVDKYIDKLPKPRPLSEIHLFA
jgi:hypothetical protein